MTRKGAEHSSTKILNHALEHGYLRSGSAPRFRKPTPSMAMMGWDAGRSRRFNDREKLKYTSKQIGHASVQVTPDRLATYSLCVKMTETVSYWREHALGRVSAFDNQTKED